MELMVLKDQPFSDEDQLVQSSPKLSQSCLPKLT